MCLEIYEVIKHTSCQVEKNSSTNKGISVIATNVLHRITSIHVLQCDLEMIYETKDHW